MTRHINGFRPLRDGEEWAWCDLPLQPGERPLLKTERAKRGDTYLSTHAPAIASATSRRGPWGLEPVQGVEGYLPKEMENYSYVLTTRPLP